LHFTSSVMEYVHILPAVGVLVKHRFSQRK
jgi:hypothetical protein